MTDEDGPHAQRAPLLERFHVAEFGPVDARPMVFAHGYATNQTVWRHVAPAFGDDFHVTLFDHLGGGGSATLGEGHTSLYDYADDVIELLRGLGLRQVIWVGHSVSGVIGALASTRAPDLFERLIMVGPSARYLDDEGYVGGFSQSEIRELLATLDSDFSGWAQAMAPTLAGADATPDVTSELEALLTAQPQGPGGDVARHTLLADHRADFQHVDVPALVMQGSSDPLAPVAVGRFIERNLPNGHFVQLAATGHFPNLSAPAEVIAAIRAFV